MKKFFTKIHLWLSLPLGIVIAIICCTGAILVFENEMLEARYPSRYFVNEVGEKTLPPSQLVEKVHFNPRVMGSYPPYHYCFFERG